MTTSSKTNMEEIRFYLDNLVLEIGKQVTRDYRDKNGIWEGMSVSNTKTVSLYADKLFEIFTQAKEAGREEMYEEIRQGFLNTSTIGQHTIDVLQELQSK